MKIVRRPTLRLKLALFGLFLGFAVILWERMPEPYPVHFGLGGSPAR